MHRYLYVYIYMYVNYFSGVYLCSGFSFTNNMRSLSQHLGSGSLPPAAALGTYRMQTAPASAYPVNRTLAAGDDDDDDLRKL